MIYLYAELYNLSYDSSDSNTFRVAYRLLDQNGETFEDFGYRLRSAPGKSAVVADQFDSRGWPTGQYRLRMIATDLKTEQADTAFLDLKIVPKVRPRPVLAVNSYTDPYDTLSLTDREHLVAYLLTPNDKKTLSRLTETGKNTFLDQFWREHDSNPDTRVIENRLEMIERYNFANRFFSTNSRHTDGWTTDRGRIYMLYGPWDQRDDISSPEVGDSYTVWHYYSVRQGVLFVFEDRQGFNDYTLVHSNLEGEIFSKAWQDRLERDIYLRSE